MSTNISNGSPFLNNRDNSSMIPDVLEQIKKKSEEISTSDASIKLLANLSNPTNLTNPQIITSLNHNKNNLFPKNKKLPSLKPNRLIFSNDFTKKMPRKSKSEVFSNLSPFSTIDPFNLYNYYKLVEKAEFEILSDKINAKQRNRIYLEKIDRNIITGRNYKNFNNPYNNLPDNKSEKKENENIWDKIKSANLVQLNRPKDKKTNFIRFIPKKDYIEKTNLIKLLQFNTKNKNKRYYNYLSRKNAQIMATNDTINKLQKSKNYLENNYNEEFVAYINFLRKELEKENKEDILLKVKRNEILFYVNKLQRQIDKITNKKKDLIKWLYLQIQVKENLPEFPRYYEYIIEDYNFSIEEINKMGKGKYNIDLDEYFRILNYRGKNVYDNVDDFFKKLEDLEIKSLTILNNKLDSLEEHKILKKEYEELKKNIFTSENAENDKLNELNYKLRSLKKLNYELRNKLNSLKELHNKKKFHDILLFNKITTYAQLNENIRGMNFFLKNKKDMLYYLVVCTYYITTLNCFEEMKYKKITFDMYQEDNKMILEILIYAEKIVNLLIEQKKYYYSNDKLKKIYENIKEEINKKTKIEKIMIQKKIRKQKEIEKREKLNEKLNKQYYKPTRKIDYDYFRKEMNKKNQPVMNKSVKKETKFEDFFYDIDS